jgi:DNA-binding NtrC family response regulator
MSARVLVVDDEKNLRLLYEREFADAGYEVKTAASSEEAVKAARTDTFDAVVLDIRLDEEADAPNGLDVLGELKRLDANLPVVINSAYPTFKTDFSSWGADAFVVKSSNVSELLSAVRAAIERRDAAP